MHGIELLMASCDNLKMIIDIHYFEGISDEERELLIKRTREQNLNIEFEEKIKTYVDLDADFMSKKLKEMYPAIPNFDNDATWNTG